MRNVLEIMMILIVIRWWFLIKLIVGHFNENIEIKRSNISPQLEMQVHIVPSWADQRQRITSSVEINYHQKHNTPA